MPTPAVIAHRGYAGSAPENTLEALCSAAERADTAMVELDVQPAACGTPVVIHDSRLEGTRHGRALTGLEGLVWETPLEELQSARVLGTDEAVPTLEAVLEALAETAGVNVELKNPGTSSLRAGESLEADGREKRREDWRPFVERVVADCRSFAGELLFSSFCEGAIAALREGAPEYAAAVLVWDDLEAGIELARRYDCEAIHPPKNAIKGTALADTAYAGFSANPPEIDVLAVAHEEGRAVNVWTVDTWLEFDVLAEAGVDGIIAEYPGLGRGCRR